MSEALYHLELALTYSHHDLAEQIVIDAICLRISSGIDALGALPAEIRDNLTAGQWPSLRGMRNRIAHGYLGIDEAIIIETVRNDLPVLVGALHRVLVTARGQ
nr:MULTISPECIES: HepT-like ribonuclease domain-containing protein [unclassified Actinomyces]